LQQFLRKVVLSENGQYRKRGRPNSCVTSRHFTTRALLCWNLTLEKYLDEYVAGAEIAGDAEGLLFRTTGRKTGQAQAMWQQDAYRMIQRRAADAGIKTRIGNHTFRATGITVYLKNKGTLEHAQTIRQPLLAANDEAL
jgi:integrase